MNDYVLHTPLLGRYENYILLPEITLSYHLCKITVVKHSDRSDRIVRDSEFHFSIRSRPYMTSDGRGKGGVILIGALIKHMTRGIIHKRAKIIPVDQVF